MQFKTVNQKSYLNFVPVQIKTFIFTRLAIYPPKFHPSIHRATSLEDACYLLFLLQALVITKAADTNLHENPHFANLLMKRHIQLELHLLCWICAFPTLYFFLLPSYSCDSCSSRPPAEMTTEVHA